MCVCYMVDLVNCHSGGVANGSSPVPNHVMEGHGTFELALQADNRVYIIHTVHTLHLRWIRRSQLVAHLGVHLFVWPE